MLYISGDVETHKDLVEIIEDALGQREKILERARMDLDSRLDTIRDLLNEEEINEDEIRAELDALEIEIKAALET